jgi:hypothetical protein
VEYLPRRDRAKPKALVEGLEGAAVAYLLDVAVQKEFGFRRKGASLFRDFHFALAVSSISQARKDIFLLKTGKLSQNVGVRHSAG